MTSRLNGPKQWIRDILAHRDLMSRTTRIALEVVWLCLLEDIKKHKDKEKNNG